jgi:hypothetical protein
MLGANKKKRPRGPVCWILQAIDKRGREQDLRYTFTELGVERTAALLRKQHPKCDIKTTEVR